jgi:1-acyl-sn-glycerol-3-phosphate acyltransferase
MLRSLLFYLLWIALTLMVGVFGLPCLLSHKATCKLADIWCDISFLLLRLCCNILVDIPTIPHPRGKLFACNHESTLDTLMLWRALDHPAFILKRELHFIPIFGWYLWRVRPIAIRRFQAKSIHMMIRQTRARLAENRAVIIFPEGTRSAPEKILPYKRGVALISAQLQQPVQLLALHSYRFWPKGHIQKTSGTASLIALNTLAACGENQREWLDEMAKTIRSAAAKLHANALADS